MNQKDYVKIVVLVTAVLFTATLFNSGAFSQNIENQMSPLPLNDTKGHYLYTPYHSTTTYLINETGVVNHTWESTYTPKYDSYMWKNGSIYLVINSGRGGVQKIDYNGTILWDWRYTRDSSYATHDITILPNGDFIIIMQEIKSHAAAVQAGRDPNTVGTQFFPNMLIQVNQTGPTSGDIVWEWHVWDHLIQDFDASKDNYGVVSEHPELADINFDQPWVTGWPYFTSVDYNPKFDQILISAHNFDEVWIIDHSTTTEEAASHEGGIYGHGGDLLYRWGNPQTYNQGVGASDKKLYFQHQSCWIKPGLPGAGNILVFSNGVTRPGGPLSSVDEFTPAVNNETGEYYLPPGGIYGPDDLCWQYMLPQNLYSYYFGGAQRKLNNNTLICSGWNGIFIEVTSDKQIVWTYDNPYPYLNDQVYRTQYIPPYVPPPPPPPPPPLPHPDLECTGNLSWSNIKPGTTVHGSFQVLNKGDNDTRLNWTVNNTITWGTWTFFPSSGENLLPWVEPFTVQVYVVVPNEQNQLFTGTLRVENRDNASDYVDIPVTLTTPCSMLFYNPLLSWLFERFLHGFSLLRHLLGQ